MNFSSIGVHISIQKRLGSQLSSWNTQLTSSCIGQDIQIAYNEEVWSRVTSTESGKEGKGKAQFLPQYFIDCIDRNCLPIDTSAEITPF